MRGLLHAALSLGADRGELLREREQQVVEGHVPLQRLRARPDGALHELHDLSSGLWRQGQSWMKLDKILAKNDLEVF